MMAFNIHDYDFIHVGMSGGKDSTATLLWLRFESGWPLYKVVATFSETENEDALTYNYLALLQEYTGIPIQTVWPDLGFFDLAMKKKRFPSARARFCTQHLKVIPSLRTLGALMDRGRVLALTGIRKAEGTATNGRAELGEFGEHSTLAGIDEYRPMYHATLADVWEMHRKHLNVDDVVWLVEDDPRLSGNHKALITRRLRSHGIPRNPLYDMGAVRVGCFPCIHSRKAEVRAMAKYRPERIDFIRHWEEAIGEQRSNTEYSSFFSRSTIPEHLRTKLVSTRSQGQVYVPTIDDVVRWSHTAWGGAANRNGFGCGCAGGMRSARNV